MTVTVTKEEARERFEELLEKVVSGQDEVVISENGVVVARLAPPKEAELRQSAQGKRVPGSAIGRMWVADDFDAPLPDDEVDLFYK